MRCQWVDGNLPVHVVVRRRSRGPRHRGERHELLNADTARCGKRHTSIRRTSSVGAAGAKALVGRIRQAPGHEDSLLLSACGATFGRALPSTASRSTSAYCLQGDTPCHAEPTARGSSTSREGASVRRVERTAARRAGHGGCGVHIEAAPPGGHTRFTRDPRALLDDHPAAAGREGKFRGSFKVLIKVMQSLSLNVEASGDEIELRETDEDVFWAAEELGIDLSRREPAGADFD